jgi:integrase
VDEGTVRLWAGTTKNDQARIVWLPDELRAILTQQWQEHCTLYPYCPYVFYRNGNRIRSFKESWWTAYREAGLHGKVPHDLRRTGTRLLVRSGIPETITMRVTGHADRSVFERYNIVSPGDLQQVARVLNQRDMLANNDKNNDNRPVSQSENRLSS